MNPLLAQLMEMLSMSGDPSKRQPLGAGEGVNEYGEPVDEMGNPIPVQGPMNSMRVNGMGGQALPLNQKTGPFDGLTPQGGFQTVGNGPDLKSRYDAITSGELDPQAIAQFYDDLKKDGSSEARIYREDMGILLKQLGNAPAVTPQQPIQPDSLEGMLTKALPPQQAAGSLQQRLLGLPDKIRSNASQKFEALKQKTGMNAVPGIVDSLRSGVNDVRSGVKQAKRTGANAVRGAVGLPPLGAGPAIGGDQPDPATLQQALTQALAGIVPEEQAAPQRPDPATLQRALMQSMSGVVPQNQAAPQETVAGKPMDAVIEDVKRIARNLESTNPNTPTRQNFKAMNQPKGLPVGLDRMPPGLERDLTRAMTGKSVQKTPEEAAYEFATTRPAGGSRKPPREEKLKGDLERLDEMFPGSRGKTTTVVGGGTGQDNQLVRLSTGESVLMGPAAYKAYQNALLRTDEKTAMKLAKRGAQDKQDEATAPLRAKALVRAKGENALSNMPGLEGAIPPEEVRKLALARTTRLAEQQANVQRNEDRKNPLLAMMRQDGTDSPIIQQMMLMQTGVGPEDAAQIVNQRQQLKNQATSAKEDRALKVRELGQGQSIADRDAKLKQDNLEALQQQSQVQTLIKFLDAETDPMKRDAISQKLSGMVGLDAGMVPSLPPQVASLVTGNPEKDAKNIEDAVVNGLPPEQAAALTVRSELLASQNRDYKKPAPKPTSQLREQVRDQPRANSDRSLFDTLIEGGKPAVTAPEREARIRKKLAKPPEPYRRTPTFPLLDSIFGG